MTPLEVEALLDSKRCTEERLGACYKRENELMVEVWQLRARIADMCKEAAKLRSELLCARPEDCGLYGAGFMDAMDRVLAILKKEEHDETRRT